MASLCHLVLSFYPPPYWPACGEDSEINDWTLWLARVDRIPLQISPPLEKDQKKTKKTATVNNTEWGKWWIVLKMVELNVSVAANKLFTIIYVMQTQFRMSFFGVQRSVNTWTHLDTKSWVNTFILRGILTGRIKNNPAYDQSECFPLSV